MLARCARRSPKYMGAERVSCARHGARLEGCSRFARAVCWKRRPRCCVTPSGEAARAARDPRVLPRQTRSGVGRIWCSESTPRTYFRSRPIPVVPPSPKRMTRGAPTCDGGPTTRADKQRKWHRPPRERQHGERPPPPPSPRRAARPPTRGAARARPRGAPRRSPRGGRSDWLCQKGP